MNHQKHKSKNDRNKTKKIKPTSKQQTATNTNILRRGDWHRTVGLHRPWKTKRADSVTPTADGLRFACDVMARAAPTLWDEHRTHLDRLSAAKATRYNTCDWSYTHDRAQMVHLVHDAHNRWSEPSALRLLLLHKLVTVVAKSSAPMVPATCRLPPPLSRAWLQSCTQRPHAWARL